LTTRSRIVLAVHKALLRTARTRFGRIWMLGYRLAARAWAAYLAAGERDSAAYVRGGLGSADALPGLSDVDVALVLAEDRRGPGLARERAAARWLRLRRAFRLTDLLLDYPLIIEEPELHEAVGESALTYGGAAYFGPALSQDRIRMLERPGLYGTTTDWRLLSGPDRRPPEAARGMQARHIAAWLELVYWWQWVFPACADRGPRTASLCVKLVAEPVRIWLWLAHGERVEGRAQALRRGLERLPEEEAGLRRVGELERELHRSPDPPLAEVLPLTLRMSSRIARLVADQVAEHGSKGVRLEGTDRSDLILPHGAALSGLLPLCDWKALAFPWLPDDSFGLSDGDPGDPGAIAAATCGVGPYSALRADGVMVLPATRSRSELRALKCRVADPVSFALAEGSATAPFPNVAGWSAQDCARRAVTEHLAWLQSPPALALGAAPEEAAGSELGMLLSAGRAALFHESVREGAPELAVTITAAARRIGADEGLEAYREFALYRTPPPASTLAAVRRLVGSLDPLRGEAGLLRVKP
jgi:hypothetical protein